MTKVQSGVVLIVVALVINLIGRGLTRAAVGGHSVGMAALVTVIMLIAAVVGLVGLFRLIVGMRDKS